MPAGSINKPFRTIKMNLKNPHRKSVQTNMLSLVPKGKVISANRSGEHLKEHLSKVPALLVCVSGNDL
jgi:hypothetical protein